MKPFPRLHRLFDAIESGRDYRARRLAAEGRAERKEGSRRVDEMDTDPELAGASAIDDKDEPGD